MRKFILLSLLALTQVLGDICLSRGMKQFGEIAAFTPSIIKQVLIHLFTNHWIWLGVAMLIISLSLYLTAISRLDLSYVLPIHASTYVLNAYFAWSILGEHISTTRWASTFLIAIGVAIVSLSQSQPFNQPKKPIKVNQKTLPWLFFPLSFHLSRTWLAILTISLADSTGDLLLAMGMKQIGKMELQSAPKMLKKVHKIIINPVILCGICCQTIAFAAFISVLSWADISFVRPATALSYIFSLIGARYILQEKLDAVRLFGIIFVGVGILIHQ